MTRDRNFLALSHTLNKLESLFFAWAKPIVRNFIAIFLKLDNGYRNSMFYGKATIHNSIRDN